MSENAQELLDLTTSIVSAYVAHNNVPAGELTDLIASTHAVLAKLGEPEAAAVAPPVPAVSIRKSVSPDAIICLEDGKAFKSLKRHLSSKYDLTPEQYRVKWGLPADYPMVAPSYAERRSALAKSIGLGNFRRTAAPVVAPTNPKPKRGRPAKAQSESRRPPPT